MEGLALPGVVSAGSAARPLVALTYDDGPGSGTEAVLEQLAAFDSRATFFLVGSEAERNPALAGAIVDGGHDIGSHTLWHLDHDQVDAAQAVSDMLDGAAAVERAVGFEPLLYRAPYGHFTAATVAAARERGWTCVGWSALGMDWLDGETPRTIADRVAHDLKPGAIVLLHDARRARPIDPEPVVGATALLLAEIRRRGLRAVSVGELLNIPG
jgi:peptidoglycan-N-acetylglucosamine deacetylase